MLKVLSMEDGLDDYFESEVRGSSTSANIHEEISNQALINDIKALGQQEKISMSVNTFSHYENLRSKGLIREDLFDIVMVALSAPAIQVSVERACSTLSLLMLPKWSSLKDSTIDDILK